MEKLVPKEKSVLRLLISYLTFCVFVVRCSGFPQLVDEDLSLTCQRTTGVDSYAVAA